MNRSTSVKSQSKGSKEGSGSTRELRAVWDGIPSHFSAQRMLGEMWMHICVPKRIQRGYTTLPQVVFQRIKDGRKNGTTDYNGISQNFSIALINCICIHMNVTYETYKLILILVKDSPSFWYNILSKLFLLENFCEIRISNFHHLFKSICLVPNFVLADRTFTTPSTLHRFYSFKQLLNSNPIFHSSYSN